MDRKDPSEQPKTFTPPEGMPGLRALELRKEQARGILAARRIRLTTDATLVQLKTEAIAKALVAAGIVTLEQLEYYFQLALTEALEEAVVKSTPAPRLHLPGREGLS